MTTAATRSFTIPKGGDKPPESIRRDRYGRWLAYFPSRGWYPAIPVPMIKRWGEEFFDWTLDARIWYMTDKDRESWKLRVEEDRRLQRAIKKDGTLKFLRTIYQLARRHEQHEGGNAIIAIKGPRRAGKSFLAFSIAGLWRRLLKSSIHICFSAEFTETFRNASEGDIIIVDENSELSSQDSSNFIHHRKNLIDQTGIKKIAVIFISPDIDFKRLGRSLDLGIEWFGAWISKNATRFVVYDHEERPLFVAGLQRTFLWSEEPFLSYRQRKHKMLDELIDASGASSVSYRGLWKKYYDIVMNEVKKRYRTPPSISTIESIVVRDLSLQLPSTNFLRQLCSRVRDDLRANIENEENIDEINIDESSNMTNNDFLHILHDIAFRIISKRAGESNARRLIIYYFSEKKYTFGDVRDILGLPVRQDAISKAVRDTFGKMTKTDWGNIGEIAVQKYLQNRFSSHIDSIAGAVERSVRCGCISERDNTHDLAIRIGDGKEDFVAINVKLFVKETNERPIHISPEFKHKPNAAIIISSRPLRVEVITPVVNEYERLAQARKEHRVIPLEEFINRIIESNM